VRWLWLAIDRKTRAALAKLVAHAQLPVGRLLERKVKNRPFHGGVDAVLHVRLPPADLLQDRLAAGVLQGFEPVETVAGVAHYLARAGHVPKLPRKFHDSDLRLDDFLLACHSVLLVKKYICFFDKCQISY